MVTAAGADDAPADVTTAFTVPFCPGGNTSHGICALIWPGETNCSAALTPLNVTETFPSVVESVTVSVTVSCVARLLPKIATILPAETGRPAAKPAASTTPPSLITGVWPKTAPAANRPPSKSPDNRFISSSVSGRNKPKGCRSCKRVVNRSVARQLRRSLHYLGVAIGIEKRRALGLCLRLGLLAGLRQEICKRPVRFKPVGRGLA